MIDQPIKSTHVLLIEDKPEDFEFIQMLLTHTEVPYRIEWASDLNQAYERLESFPRIDVILLDLNLQDSKGINTLSLLMSHMPQAPIVVLTGLDDDEVGFEAMRKGAQDYLVKSNANSKSLSRTIQYAIERKRATDLLNLSEDRFRKLVKTAQVAIVCISPNYKILEFNHHSESVFGARREDVIGRNFMDLFVPMHERSKMRWQIAKALNGDLILDGRNEIKTPQGNERFVSYNLSRIINMDGTPLGALVCAFDTTKSDRLENEIKIREETCRALAKNFPKSAVFLIDRNERLIMADGPLLEVNGFREEFFEGRKMADFLTASEYGRLRAIHQNVIDHGTRQWTLKRYHSRVYRIDLFPIHDQSGSILFSMAIAQDVTRKVHKSF